VFIRVPDATGHPARLPLARRIPDSGRRART